MKYFPHFFLRQRDEYFHLHMYKPWTHLSVYAIGVGAGLFCADRKKGFSGGPYGRGVASLIGWCSIAIAAGAIIFAPHEWVLGNLPDVCSSPHLSNDFLSLSLFSEKLAENFSLS